MNVDGKLEYDKCQWKMKHDNDTSCCIKRDSCDYNIKSYILTI